MGTQCRIILPLLDQNKTHVDSKNKKSIELVMLPIRFCHFFYIAFSFETTLTKPKNVKYTLYLFGLYIITFSFNKVNTC